MSIEVVAALIGAVSGLVGVLMGEWSASRRWRAEMEDTRQRREAEALEQRRQELRAEITDRRAATRDDYSAILTFLDLLDRCIVQCILTMDEATEERLITKSVVGKADTVAQQLTQLHTNADYSLAVERGATDNIRSALKMIRRQILELRFEMSLAFGFVEMELNEGLSQAAKDRANWLRGEAERVRGLVRQELNVG